MNLDKEHILQEIRRTAQENGGKPLGTSRFKAETGISSGDWEGKYWARWGDALVEAGFEPNEMQASYEEDFLLGKLVEIIQSVGRYPTVREVKLRSGGDTGVPSHNVFQRLGKKHELAAKVIEYCRTLGGLDDVIAICEPVAATPTPSDEPSVTDGPVLGYVYLMKSGKFYKVGRSKDADFRRGQLAIQLPEKIALVHTIKTDDPVGIEAYWHQRFADRRKNGEWFELTATDVKAFKRRKFM